MRAEPGCPELVVWDGDLQGRSEVLLVTAVHRFRSVDHDSKCLGLQACSHGPARLVERGEGLTAHVRPWKYFGSFGWCYPIQEPFGRDRSCSDVRTLGCRDRFGG